MSLWIILVVVAQMLNALVTLVDKYVVTSKTVSLRPFAYTFWISVLSSVSLLLFFFDGIPIPIDGLAIPSFSRVAMPTLLTFALAITTGYSFFSALLSFFTALKQADASDTVPVVGAVTACCTLALSYFLLGGTLPKNFLIGFSLLVVGTAFVSRFRFSWRTVLAVTHAGVMFGVHFIALKALFQTTNFDTAFFWSRLAIVLVALSMLLIPEYYEKILSHTKRARVRDGFFIVGNKVLAGIASFLILKATEHGDVALVQALGGLQYIFLLLISLFFGRFIARDAGENLSRTDIVHKAISIPIIALGFFLLFL
jgi:uncharacterized membrane protein